MFPLITKAVVLAQEPDNYRLTVSAIGQLGGQSPALSVAVLTHGPRDGVRGDFPELPMPGTWGLVAFPSSDGRNGHWIGSAEPALNDANPGAPATVSPRYRAHYAGGWHWTGPDGTTVERLADGSYLLSGASLPVPTRHTVDGGQNRQRTPFTDAERNPSPPGPYPLQAVHATGSAIGFDASGNVTASAASGKTVTASANGASIVIGAAGQVTVTTASGQALTLSCNGASIVMDASGDITLTAAGGVVAKLAGAILSVGASATPVRLANGSASTDLYAS